MTILKIKDEDLSYLQKFFKECTLKPVLVDTFVRKEFDFISLIFDAKTEITSATLESLIALNKAIKEVLPFGGNIHQDLQSIEWIQNINWINFPQLLHEKTSVGCAINLKNPISCFSNYEEIIGKILNWFSELCLFSKKDTNRFLREYFDKLDHIRFNSFLEKVKEDIRNQYSSGFQVFEYLPLEIQSHIFSFLPEQKIKNIATVSQFWNSLSKDSIKIRKSKDNNNINTSEEKEDLEQKEDNVNEDNSNKLNS